MRAHSRFPVCHSSSSTRWTLPTRAGSPPLALAWLSRIFTVAAVAGIGACSTAATAPIEGPRSDAGASSDAGLDTGLNDAGPPGPAALWPVDAEEVVATSEGGGFAPPPPPGSTCILGVARYAVAVSAKTLHFERCMATGAAPFQLVKGDRTLSPAEFATVDTAMRGLTSVVDKTACGTDKPRYTVSVKTPRGAMTYEDAFYACQGGGKLYVENIDELLDVLAKLAAAQ